MLRFNHILSVLVSVGLSLIPSCKLNSDTATEPNYVVGFSQCTDDMWRQIMMVQMQTEATKYPNLKLVTEQAYNSTETQIEQIENLISQGVDLLIISPNESEPITPIAVEAYRSGIPTIIWDRKIDSDQYTTFISADNYAIGRDVGQYVQAHLPLGSSILEIYGLSGSSPAQERHKGLTDVVNGNYNIRSIYGDWQPSVAKARVEDLGSYGDIDFVFGHNDDMAIAAYDAIAQNDSLSAHRIKFVGIDAIVGVDAVIDGRLEASFLYPPGGEFVVQTAMNILNGKEVDKTYTLRSSIVDKSNAATLKSQSDQILDYQNHINRQRRQIDTMADSYRYLRYSMVAVVVALIIIVPLCVYSLLINQRIRRRNLRLLERNRDIESDTQELVMRNSQIENDTNQKLQFFTNISHEVRTPLTLILNPLDTIATREKDPDIQRDIWVIQRNAKRLLKIVNQLLDFRKVENNKMTLSLKEVDIVGFTNEVLNYFEAYAESEKIVYKFSSDKPSEMIWIDTEKMEQVLMNLISNAFKNSKKYGDILVSITDTPDSVIISVHDNGRGIDIQSQQHIFDRFYSVGNGRSSGTGIGLHLTKEYVDMHCGKISVDSQIDKFTTFTVELGKGRDHFPKEAMFDDGISTQLTDAMESDNVRELLSRHYDETVLVAEDDEDIRNYLVGVLSENFNVIAVGNGYEATRAVLDNAVSVVLSDVLMPQINGFKLCHNIKTNVATSHIPVILLTALSDDNQRIYGIAEGADEYIRKPFNVDYVRMKIIRILEERRQLKESFAKRFNADKFLDVSVKDIPCADDIFRDKLFDLIEAEYENSELSIEQISDRLGMSRVQVYRKVKSIFGLTPNDLLRSFRLNKSVLLLQSGRKLSIGEVAYMCGFSSPSYFSKCYKDYFGSLPSDNGR